MLGDKVRTFYIFKIRKEMMILTKESPYNLFRTIEQLYYLDNHNLDISFQIYNDIFSSINKNYVDKKITSIFKNNRYYSFDNDKHTIYNKYKPELSLMRVYKSHIILKSDNVKPTLLTNYLKSENLFVCDFKNKDYFWLTELVR